MSWWKVIKVDKQSLELEFNMGRGTFRYSFVNATKDETRFFDGESLGIEGLVYEILNWDKKYEHAVMAVCSDWIKAVVVKDFSTLVSLADRMYNLEM